jgi:hypothetical protein
MVAGATAPAARGQIRELERGPVHEAFLPPVTEVTALEAIDREPPPPITERIPKKCDPEAVWIEGYWEFDDEIDDFILIPGVWRKPPPGMHWINGLWKEYDEGWVRIRGFWSKVPAEDLTYIPIEPPDPFDEDPGSSPGRAFFWMRGYWGWLAEREQYAPFNGRWLELDRDWILVPAHYIFRPGGYIFVAAYWDWPLDKRGCAYRSVFIEPAARVEVVYEPVVILEPEIVIDLTFGHYPDYWYFFHHHYHFHDAWWHDHYDPPPWWAWDTWGGLPWHHHWGVWWWYTHPGHAHPHWMTHAMASHIHPPSEKLILATKFTKAPLVVTEHGVLPPSKVLEAAKKAKGKDDKAAVVSKKKLKEAVKETAKIEVPAAAKAVKLEPAGKKEDTDAAKAAGKKPPKPKTGLSAAEAKAATKLAEPTTTKGKAKGKEPAETKTELPKLPKGDDLKPKMKDKTKTDTETKPKAKEKTKTDTKDDLKPKMKEKTKIPEGKPDDTKAKDKKPTETKPDESKPKPEKKSKSDDKPDEPKKAKLPDELKPKGKDKPDDSKPKGKDKVDDPKSKMKEKPKGGSESKAIDSKPGESKSKGKDKPSDDESKGKGKSKEKDKDKEGKDKDKP